MSANQAFAGAPSQAFAGAGSSTPAQNPAYRQPAAQNPAYEMPPAPTTPVVTNATVIPSKRERAPREREQASAPPVQYRSQPKQSRSKPKLERVLCGSCGATNGVPPGAPSFNCYKCGRTSTKPGLKQEPPPTQYVQGPPQQTTVQQPVQVVQQPTTVVVQQPAQTVVAAPYVGNQLAYGAYGGRSDAAAAGFATGMLMGAMLDPRPCYGFGPGPMFW